MIIAPHRTIAIAWMLAFACAIGLGGAANGADFPRAAEAARQANPRAEAILVVHYRRAGGDYQGIQLADLWFSSLEYANRQTSLTADQAVLDDDGAFRFVVCATDPGVANWLDTTAS